jgi:hypothetical protein
MSEVTRLQIDKELVQDLCIALRTVAPQAFEPDFYAQANQALKIEDPQERYRRVLGLRASIGNRNDIQAAMLDQLPPESRRKIEEGMQRAAQMVEEGHLRMNDNTEANELSVVYPISPSITDVFDSFVIALGPNEALLIGTILMMVGAVLAVASIFGAIAGAYYLNFTAVVAAFLLVCVGVGVFVIGLYLVMAADKAAKQKKNLAAHFQWQNGGKPTLKAADGSWSYSIPAVISGDTGYAI